MNTINLRSIFPENTDVNIVKFAGVLIFAAILLVVPLIIALVFPLIKKKLNSDKKIYLYAFSSGFFYNASYHWFYQGRLGKRNRWC